MNFMARYGRGLICLSLTGKRVKELGIPLMASNNQERHQTAFTVSIEAREGVTTGISAHDRARTVAVAIDPTKGARDIVTPGHVFPLMARDGGVLVRAGHTEAAVDIARLAGLNPAGVICEIMNEDGTMARLPDLVGFAQTHGLKVATIAGLIAYRRRYDRIIHRAVETDIDTMYGGQFKLYVYINVVEYAEHIALVKGDISAPGPVPVRMHAINVFDDLLGAKSGHTGLLHGAMELISKLERGVIVLIRDTKAIRAMSFPVFHGGIGPLDAVREKVLRRGDAPLAADLPDRPQVVAKAGGEHHRAGPGARLLLAQRAAGAAGHRHGFRVGRARPHRHELSCHLWG